jgi:uncharacterized membrane protein YbaN (DUF454 family)
MSFEQIIGLMLAWLVMLAGLAGSVLPGLPGPPRVLAAAIAQRRWFGAHSVGHLVLAVLRDSQQHVIENGPLLKSRKVLS